MNEYISVSQWGMFPAPKKEFDSDALDRRKRLEKLLHPIMEQVVNIRVNA